MNSSRFHLVVTTGRGYRHSLSFSAASMQEACAKHCALYLTRKTPHALVMRSSTGRRFSFNDSAAISRESGNAA